MCRLNFISDGRVRRGVRWPINDKLHIANEMVTSHTGSHAITVVMGGERHYDVVHMDQPITDTVWVGVGDYGLELIKIFISKAF